MTQISRKTCAQCGEQNLAVDWRCWACGAPLVAAPAGSSDATTAMPAASGGDRLTLMPGAPARDWPTRTPLAPLGGVRTVAAAVGVGILLVGVAAGWQLSRWGTQPPPERGLPAPAAPLIPGPTDYARQPAAPIHLPPPVNRQPPPAASPWPPAVGPLPVRPSVRPGGGLPPRRFTGLPPGTLRPGWGALPARPSTGTGTRHGAGPEPAVLPAPGAAGDRPTVRIQNSASVPVELELAGPVLQNGRLAPGARISFPLPPGSYRLTLTGGGRRERLEGIELRSGRHYSVVFAAGGATVDGS
jgi:hypothetical protein